MKKYTQKALREMVANGIAQNITRANVHDYYALKEKEGGLLQVGYSSGVYGCNGALFKGYNTSTLYAITTRSTAIFIFC